MHVERRRCVAAVCICARSKSRMLVLQEGWRSLAGTTHQATSCCLACTDVVSDNIGITFSITAPITLTVIDLAMEVMHLEAANLTATW